MGIAPSPEILVTGIPHGWIHKPLQQDTVRLKEHDWDLFIVTKASTISIASNDDELIRALLSADFMMPQHQYQRLISDRPSGHHHPVQLPAEWTDTNTGFLHIPTHCVVEPYNDPSKAGILRLQPSTVDFLSSALPTCVQHKPVSLFNLFKYREGDSSVHDQYMSDFEEGFGHAAVAYVKFMGPLLPQLRSSKESEDVPAGVGWGWQDVDLVHYDTIYHSAYMLSTDLYQRLNRNKVRGLEDTCILVVSEAELV